MDPHNHHYDDVEKYEVPIKKCCDNASNNISVLGRPETHIYSPIPVKRRTSEHNSVQRKQRWWLIILSIAVMASLILAAIAVILNVRNGNQAIISRTTTESQAMTTTEGPVSTPVQCLEAIDLMLAFRADHNGSDIRPRQNNQYNCDTQSMVVSGRPWFRFTGAAGNRLLETCPPPRSCGTQGGMWSDADRPSKIGEVQLMNVFVSDDSGCRAATYNLGVVKCSNMEHDFVYRHEGDTVCNRGYCAMR